MSKARDATAARVFFALGDETRLTVVQKLSSHGSQSATDLSDGAKVTRQAIVKHLQVLEGAGIVTHKKQGKQVLYALRPAQLNSAQAYLQKVAESWDSALERLRAFVEDDSK